MFDIVMGVVGALGVAGVAWCVGAAAGLMRERARLTEWEAALEEKSDWLLDREERIHDVLARDGMTEEFARLANDAEALVGMDDGGMCGVDDGVALRQAVERDFTREDAQWLERLLRRGA